MEALQVVSSALADLAKFVSIRFDASFNMLVAAIGDTGDNAYALNSSITLPRCSFKCPVESREPGALLLDHIALELIVLGCYDVRRCES